MASLPRSAGGGRRRIVDCICRWRPRSRISRPRPRRASCCSCTAASARSIRSTPSPSLTKHHGKPIPTLESDPLLEGPQSGDAAGLVAQVRPARRSRDRSVSDLYPHLAERRGRHRGHPQHVRRQLRARLGPAPDEHRLSAPGIPEPGLVGDLRAGDGESEPAGLRRPARPARRPDLGPAQLGRGLHAGDLPGNAVSHQRRPDLEPAAAGGHLGRPAAQPARPAGQAEPAAAGRRRQRGAGGPDRQLRAGLSDAGAALPRPSTWRANRRRRSGSTGSTTRGPSGSAGAA